MDHLILLLPLLPFAGSGLLMLTPSGNQRLLSLITLSVCWICFVITGVLLLRFDVHQTGFQFLHRFNWIESMGIRYQVGLDGINMTLCVLHALVSLAGAYVSCWKKEGLKDYLVFYLMLVGAIYGVFTALDMFLLYLYYELTLIPLYPMIGIWGSKNKEYGAMKLTLFITAGAVLALTGIMLLYRNLGADTFDLIELRALVKTAGLLPKTISIMTALMLVGFGVIASLWPLHSWSPIGYAAAPTSVSMLHAGVLKKMGPYLILRIAVMILPDGVRQWSDILAVLAGIGILYAGYAAVRQTDLKFMIGFSSVSHMGYVLLGIAAMTPVSLAGTVLLMFSHGVMAAATFATIGFVYEQTHARGVNDFGGLAKQTPFIAMCFILTSLASLGLPGFSNFISEVLIFIGSWQRYPVMVVMAVLGVFITSLYLLRMIKQVCYGEVNPRRAQLKDALSWQERFPFILLIGALLAVGFWPQLLLRFIEPAVGALAS